MKINAIIVDDEAHARKALTHLLKDYPDIHVLGEFENGKTAVKAVFDLNPQVVFLDIQMPKLDGFEVLELLGDDAPLIVFVTAHDEYAIQAFDKNALDYLLKPVEKERLATTVQRIEERINEANGTPGFKEAEPMLQQRQLDYAPMSRILVREKADVYVVPATDVFAIEAADDYVVIHTAEKSHIKQERLGNLESRLDAQQFCRIHRSTIINLDFLHGIESEGKDSKYANLKIGNEHKQFAISRSGYSKLISLL